MSMTKEEAITNLEKLVVLFHTESEQSKMVDYSKIIETLEFAASALCSITREQVEKMRGEWTTDGVCSRCGFDAMYYKGVPVQVRTNYCPNCGAPMTDEAVDMVMERLEALHSETKTD